MKSQILKIGDKLAISEDFLIDNERRNPQTYKLWKAYLFIRVLKLSDYSTVKVGVRGFSTWVDNELAESMRKDYLNK